MTDLAPPFTRDQPAWQHFEELLPDRFLFAVFEAFNGDTRGSIVLDGYKRFAPDGWAKIEQSQELRGLAAKYPGIIQQVHYNSYNPAVADQAARGVEV